MPITFTGVKLSTLTSSFILGSKILVVALYYGMMNKKEWVRKGINRIW